MTKGLNCHITLLRKWIPDTEEYLYGLTMDEIKEQTIFQVFVFRTQKKFCSFYSDFEIFRILGWKNFTDLETKLLNFYLCKKLFSKF